MPVFLHYVAALALIAGGSALFLHARDNTASGNPLLGGWMVSPLLLQVIGFTAAAAGIMVALRAGG